MLVPLGKDFTDAHVVFEIPASPDVSGVFEIPASVTTIIDDEIDEFEQSFILVSEIGSEVPESFLCFQRQAVGDDACFGRSGATEVRILDNDGEFVNNRTSLLLHFSLLCIALQF